MWTTFWDMSSGGGQKLPWKLIFIEADAKEAKAFFEDVLGRNPDNVTCNCCGGDYSIDIYNDTLEQVTGYHRHCASAFIELATGREVEKDEAWKSGKGILDGYASQHVERQRYFLSSPDVADGKYQTLEEFELRPDVLIVRRVKELQGLPVNLLGVGKPEPKRLTAGNVIDVAPEDYTIK